jgi:Fe2+ transport system protein FeoA
MTDGAASQADRPLDRLGPGERGIIARLNGDPQITRRLMELGVRGVHLSLRRSEASHIHVATG